ncbi:DUF6455 family protein [Lutimaribacter sp. EGI FJ00015]|uniref:DUF6455 family protein n=1 Tax=Lutimaribacter degradans TaxID=2945989 RepID=A0ACC5ZTB5_9RHOB|nr:DUF6455 family protein [Lutimaribacter sp. EGI FJ00013]MCM2561593.1 DUF6455 family protein [Lutimaribacter sp. EGI FJ00013]MCO0612696.1 DUF6455 family protein [Lutimaribacter sp. EGI FJ00015]MCO0635354.1 DUF6455 family protein [Lutimaribacter sp. EGI FJ00014]
MRNLGNPITHFWLVQDMARAAGVDLPDARRQGRLTAGEWTAMITRCRGCAWAEKCQSWLAAQDMGEPAQVPPACATRAVFDSLCQGD